jgi:hypothetical protein
VGRFDRDKTNTDGVSAPAGRATQRLRSTLERYAHEVVEGATARAAAIEERALVKATEIERQSQRKADEVLQESRQKASDVLERATHRAEGMLHATETLQGELVKVIASFREEIELLASELKSARGNFTPAEPTLEPTPEPTPEPMPELTPEPMPELIPEPAPELIPEPAPEPMPADQEESPAETPHALEPEPAPEPLAPPEPPAEEQQLTAETVEAVEPEPPELEPPAPEPPARPEPTEPPAPQWEQIASQDPQDGRGSVEQSERVQSPEASGEVAEEPEVSAPSDDAPVMPDAPGLDRLASIKIRQQLVRLKESGKPRADAERYLERFHNNREYAVVLDEIYGPGEPAKQRRGLLRRR